MNSSLPTVDQPESQSGDLAGDGIAVDPFLMARAAILLLLDRGHPVTFLPGRTVLCVGGDWFAFCDVCGGNPIGQYTSERVATSAKCWGCSEREKSARWAEVFVGRVRVHVLSVAQLGSGSSMGITSQSESR